MSDGLSKELGKLKKKIVELEDNKLEISETDTRQGLINPLFRELGWDFADFTTVRSEFTHPEFKEPVDYAFFAGKDREKPVLILEAKRFGSNLNDKNVVHQLTRYLGSFGVQWGILTDGNKYVLYNSRGGDSFAEQKFMMLEVKKIDTDDGLNMAEFCEQISGLASKKCLENEDIQKNYEFHMRNTKIGEAFESLLTEPFDTLVKSIQREFKEDRVGQPQGYKISKQDIELYLKNVIADEEGRINIEQSSMTEDTEVIDDALSQSVSPTKSEGTEKRERRVKLSDLIDSGLMHEGDNLKLNFKGEIFWARVTGNGHLEAEGKEYPNPSKAASELANKSMNGWYHWHFKNLNGVWERITILRDQFKKQKHHENVLEFSRKSA
ncbi:MAG: type I restriction enzyme HsdR N-terminal domain-containing protein [Oligoflexales bacterium]